MPQSLPVDDSVVRFKKIILIIAVVWYILMAIVSSGYYHPDEHYQLIEFARFKLGWNSVNDLPWEYRAAIRSGFQPFLCYIIFKSCAGLGITDPYALVLILRLLTAILSIAIISFFVGKTIEQVPIQYRKLYVVLAFFLWFLPFINVRFSSETWSGLFVLLAVGFLYWKSYTQLSFFLSGACIGLAILCRFQAGVMAAGLLGWLILVKKIKISDFLYLSFGILPVMALGLLIDRWLYGSWEFTIWNYFKVDILDNVSSTFGVSPWYEIIEYIISGPGIPLGLFILLSIVLMFTCKFYDVYAWVVVPLIVVHACIPHQEMRFLFPTVNFLPIMIVKSAHLLSKLKAPLYSQALARYIFLGSFGIINVCGLLALSSKASGAGRSTVTAYIHHRWHGKAIKLMLFDVNNPYAPWDGLKERHYEDPTVTTIHVTDPDEAYQQACREHSLDTIWLLAVSHKFKYHPWFVERVTNKNFAFKMQGIPDWVCWLNNFYNGFEEEDVVALYEVKPPSPINFMN